MKTIIRMLTFTAIFIVADSGLARAQPTETIVVAGGCFWGVESVFEHTNGVTESVAGYTGGQADTAHYDKVSGGDTGHAESVKVTFDPQQISLSQLLDIYFTVAHDPTELNYQGPDHGTQYRSTVFYATPEQQKSVEDKIVELNAKKAFSKPIVTTLEPLKGFYAAEDYHQHYAEAHPHNPYILINDAPKVSRLKSAYPAIYKE
jgi:peptide-methionine (S)-S-oxide reductase